MVKAEPPGLRGLVSYSPTMCDSPEFSDTSESIGTGGTRQQGGGPGWRGRGGAVWGAV